MKIIKIVLSFVLSICFVYIVGVFLTLLQDSDKEFNYIDPINLILFAFGWGLGKLGYALLIVIILVLSLVTYKIISNKKN